MQTRKDPNSTKCCSRKVKNYIANNKLWIKKSKKNILRLVFRDYSCFFREKFPESFVCYLLFYRDVYSIGWAKQVWNLLEHGVVVGQGIFYIYQMIFIGENRRNVLEVTKMMSYEKFNLYLNFISKFKGSSRHQHF